MRRLTRCKYARRDPQRSFGNPRKEGVIVSVSAQISLREIHYLGEGCDVADLGIVHYHTCIGAPCERTWLLANLVRLQVGTDPSLDSHNFKTYRNKASIDWGLEVERRRPVIGFVLNHGARAAA